MKSVGVFCNVRSFCTESSVGPIATGHICRFLFKWNDSTGFQGTELWIFSESPQNSDLKGPDKGFCKHSTLFNICVKLIFANTHISNTTASELYCAINKHNTIYLVTVVRTANMLTPSPNCHDPPLDVCCHYEWLMKALSPLAFSLYYGSTSHLSNLTLKIHSFIQLTFTECLLFSLHHDQG